MSELENITDFPQLQTFISNAETTINSACDTLVEEDDKFAETTIKLVGDYVNTVGNAWANQFPNVATGLNNCLDAVNRCEGAMRATGNWSENAG